MRYLIILFLLLGSAFAATKRDGISATNIDGVTGAAKVDGVSIGSTTYEGITARSAGTLRNDFTGKVGFRFIPGVNMTVTELARWKVAGNTASRTVSLYNVDTATLMASVALTMSSGTDGTFYYGAITPQALTAGTVYAVVSTEANNAPDMTNQWYTDDQTLTFSADLGTVRSCYSDSFTISTSNQTFVPVNFKYTKP